MHWHDPHVWWEADDHLMFDEKDIEIAKLRGQVDALEKLIKQFIAPQQPIAIMNGYYRCAGCGQLVPNASHYVHYCWSTTTITPHVWTGMTSFSLTAGGACEPATDWTLVAPGISSS